MLQGNSVPLPERPLHSQALIKKIIRTVLPDFLARPVKGQPALLQDPRSDTVPFTQ
jgi:hypothetical protein